MVLINCFFARKLNRSYQNIILHVFAWSPMYKLNLWCMIVPPLGSHGTHNHTPQVQFTHTRPRKDMQNMLLYIPLLLNIVSKKCCQEAHWTRMQYVNVIHINI